MLSEDDINKMANSLAKSRICLSAKKQKGKDFMFEVGGTPLELYTTYFLIGEYLKKCVEFNYNELELSKRIAEHIFKYAEKTYKEDEDE